MAQLFFFSLFFFFVPCAHLIVALVLPEVWVRLNNKKTFFLKKMNPFFCIYH